MKVKPHRLLIPLSAFCSVMGRNAAAPLTTAFMSSTHQVLPGPRNNRKLALCKQGQVLWNRKSLKLTSIIENVGQLWVMLLGPVTRGALVTGWRVLAGDARKFGQAKG